MAEPKALCQPVHFQKASLSWPKPNRPVQQYGTSFRIDEEGSSVSAVGRGWRQTVVNQTVGRIVRVPCCHLQDGRADTSHFRHSVRVAQTFKHWGVVIHILESRPCLQRTQIIVRCQNPCETVKGQCMKDWNPSEWLGSKRNVESWINHFSARPVT